MFTGLIEAVGDITGADVATSGTRLRVRAGFARELEPGESVAVNGVCLTVTRTHGDEMEADIGPETARVTTLGSLRRGHLVNLERPLRTDGRLGGHFVQGHVDGTGSLDGVRADGEVRWLTIGYPPQLASLLVPKGSIAVDGISLTIAALRATELDVMIVPYTWTHTNLPSLGAGDRVNLECDVIGKYVARAMEVAAAGAAVPPAKP